MRSSPDADGMPATVRVQSPKKATAVIADYDAQSAVEPELVLRLASLLWRIRRATTLETGLFEIQAKHLLEFRKSRDAQQSSIHRLLGPTDRNDHGVESDSEHISQVSGPNTVHPSPDLAQCFFHLYFCPSCLASPQALGTPEPIETKPGRRMASSG